MYKIILLSIIMLLTIYACDANVSSNATVLGVDKIGVALNQGSVEVSPAKYIISNLADGSITIPVTIYNHSGTTKSFKTGVRLPDAVSEGYEALPIDALTRFKSSNVDNIDAGDKGVCYLTIESNGQVFDKNEVWFFVTDKSVGTGGLSIGMEICVRVLIN